MNNNSNYISTAELKQISEMLKDDTNRIQEVYDKKILTALKNCESDLSVSGLEYSEIENTFKNVFLTINDQLNGLTNILEKDIIPKYEATAASIAKLFNQQFADEMTNCLNTIKNE